MKRLIVLLLLALLPLLAVAPKAKVGAGGTCTCIVGANRVCGITSDNCTARTHPQCSTAIGQCNGSAASCTCVEETSNNCGVAGRRCGGINDLPCCQGQGLTCYGGYCAVAGGLVPTPPPPGTNTDIFCGGTTSKINTALGCISANPTNFVSTLLRFGVGIAGGIAFLLIIFGGFQILTSAGNPEQLNAGKELITSTVVGLLMIIFSVFLLRLIGYNILGIPGFN